MCSLPRHAVPLTKRRRGGRGTSAAGEASLLHLLDLPPGAHGFEGPLEGGEKQQDPCPLGLEVAGHFHTRLVTQKHPATRAAPAQPRKDRRPGPAEARVLAMKDAWLARAGLGFAANESSFGRSPLPVIDANPGSCPGLWAAPTPPPLRCPVDPGSTCCALLTSGSSGYLLVYLEFPWYPGGASRILSPCWVPVLCATKQK